MVINSKIIVIKKKKIIKMLEMTNGIIPDSGPKAIGHNFSGLWSTVRYPKL